MNHTCPALSPPELPLLVEQAIGCWKRRFDCWEAGFQIDIKTAITVIVACGVLWNFLKEQNDHFDEDSFEQQIEFNDHEPRAAASLAGKEKQARIIEILYQKSLNTPANSSRPNGFWKRA